MSAVRPASENAERSMAGCYRRGATAWQAPGSHEIRGDIHAMRSEMRGELQAVREDIQRLDQKIDGIDRELRTALDVRERLDALEARRS